MKRHARLADRNCDLLLGVLRRVLPARGTVLELGSGTGEHAVAFARAFPALEWQPSDPDDEALASIAAWSREARLPNLRPPPRHDLRAPAWRARPADALLCVNVLHVAPPECGGALVAGAAEILPAGGPLVVYGPFTEGELPRSGRLARFDAELRAHDPALGVRAVGPLALAAARAGLALAEDAPGAEEGDRVLVFRRG
jgi:hypothetical protein